MIMEPLELFVTETWLRQNCKLEHGSSLQLHADAKLTPAAHGLLTDRKIKVKFGDELPSENIIAEAENEIHTSFEPVAISGVSLPQDVKTLKEMLKQEILAEIWKDLALAKAPPVAVRKITANGRSSGCCALCQQPVDEKTARLTHVGQHTLVAKNEVRLRLQGKCESALSQLGLLYAQLVADGTGNEFILNYLADLRGIVCSILKAVGSEEAPAKIMLAGMDAQAIQNIAQNPLKYLGRDHIYSDGTQGVRIAQLEVLRTHIREAELEAAAVYITHDFKILRQDILSALNQVSHAIYVLMLFVFLSEQGKTVGLTG